MVIKKTDQSFDYQNFCGSRLFYVPRLAPNVLKLCFLKKKIKKHAFFEKNQFFIVLHA